MSKENNSKEETWKEKFDETFFEHFMKIDCDCAVFHATEIKDFISTVVIPETKREERTEFVKALSNLPLGYRTLENVLNALPSLSDQTKTE